VVEMVPVVARSWHWDCTIKRARRFWLSLSLSLSLSLPAVDGLGNLAGLVLVRLPKRLPTYLSAGFFVSSSFGLFLSLFRPFFSSGLTFSFSHSYSFGACRFPSLWLLLLLGQIAHRRGSLYLFVHSLHSLASGVAASLFR
jgi:hypothetical protein